MFRWTCSTDACDATCSTYIILLIYLSSGHLHIYALSFIFPYVQYSLPIPLLDAFCHPHRLSRMLIRLMHMLPVWGSLFSWIPVFLYLASQSFSELLKFWGGELRPGWYNTYEHQTIVQNLSSLWNWDTLCCWLKHCKSLPGLHVLANGPHSRSLDFSSRTWAWRICLTTS